MKSFITIALIALIAVSSVQSLDVNWTEVKDEVMNMDYEKFMNYVQEVKVYLKTRNNAVPKDKHNRSLANSPTYVASTKNTIPADSNNMDCTHCSKPKWTSGLIKSCNRTCPTRTATCPSGKTCTNCRTTSNLFTGLSTRLWTTWSLANYCGGSKYGSDTGKAFMVLIVILLVIYLGFLYGILGGFTLCCYCSWRSEVGGRSPEFQTEYNRVFGESYCCLCLLFLFFPFALMCCCMCAHSRAMAAGNEKDVSSKTNNMMAQNQMMMNNQMQQQQMMNMQMAQGGQK